MASISCIRPANTWCNKSIGTLCGATVEPPCGAGKCPWNVQDTQRGQLHRSYIANGNLYYQRSDTSSPSIWRVNVEIVSSGDVACAHFDLDLHYFRIELYFVKNSGDWYYTYSDNDGLNWATPAAFGSSSMKDLTTSTCPSTGDKFRCWFEYNSGTSGPGKAKGQFRHYGDTSWSSTFTFKDNTSADISIADGGMCNVSAAVSGQLEWSWSPVKYGDSTPTTFASYDSGRTWQAV